MRGKACVLVFIASLELSSSWPNAFGPVHLPGYPKAGWVRDSGKVTVTNGNLEIQGDARAYLVQDHTVYTGWGDHRYVRIDLHRSPLQFTLDVSNVPCGCLACVYLVTMKDPVGWKSNYCDMAENVQPGMDDGMCYELDLLEADNRAMQTAIHTELGGKYGSGNCDRNGCFARVGGPQSPADLQRVYGKGASHRINTERPFDVITNVDEGGGMTIKLSQDGNRTWCAKVSACGNQISTGQACARSFPLERRHKLARWTWLWRVSP
ncbi:MAG: hypothetical protein SGPRY_003287 [Prymnesium sp.]